MKNSIDRTRSRRYRAGSRRNKKLKNVGSFWSDETGLYFHRMSSGNRMIQVRKEFA